MFGYRIFRETMIKKIYWIPRRLTLEPNTPVYRWLWFNYGPVKRRNLIVPVIALSLGETDQYIGHLIINNRVRGYLPTGGDYHSRIAWVNAKDLRRHYYKQLRNGFIDQKRFDQYDHKISLEETRQHSI